MFNVCSFVYRLNCSCICLLYRRNVYYLWFSTLADTVKNKLQWNLALADQEVSKADGRVVCGAATDCSLSPTAEGLPWLLVKNEQKW